MRSATPRRHEVVASPRSGYPATHLGLQRRSEDKRDLASRICSSARSAGPWWMAQDRESARRGATVTAWIPRASPENRKADQTQGPAVPTAPIPNRKTDLLEGRGTTSDARQALLHGPRPSRGASGACELDRDQRPHCKGRAPTVARNFRPIWLKPSSAGGASSGKLCNRPRRTLKSRARGSDHQSQCWPSN